MPTLLTASSKNPALLMLGLLFLTACNDDNGAVPTATLPTRPVDSQIAEAEGSPANLAPFISGNPPSAAIVGTAYGLKITVVDPDGDPVRLVAHNLPEWLMFDPALGQLSGVPTENDLGKYSGLRIEVTDGKSSATLGPFSVTVYATVSESRSVTLSWLPPTENVDGSALLALVGHKIVYGRAPDALNHAIVIDNPSVNRYIVEGLNSGTWHFGLIAKTVGEVESAMSGLVSKTIP